MNKRTLSWFIPLMIGLVLIAVCVVLLGTTDLFAVLEDIFNPAVTVSIGSMERLPDGERVRVDGYFNDRNAWYLFGYDYDCKNYFLSKNRSEPYGDTVDLCVQVGEMNMYDTITEFEGRHVRITGILTFDEKDQHPNISLDHSIYIEAAP
jgi:hypothetical protein